jgi:hypothetical protein
MKKIFILLVAFALVLSANAKSKPSHGVKGKIITMANGFLSKTSNNFIKQRHLITLVKSRMTKKFVFEWQCYNITLSCTCGTLCGDFPTMGDLMSSVWYYENLICGNNQT